VVAQGRRIEELEEELKVRREEHDSVVVPLARDDLGAEERRGVGR
jgi:hypothetical protein